VDLLITLQCTDHTYMQESRHWWELTKIRAIKISPSIRYLHVSPLKSAAAKCQPVLPFCYENPRIYLEKTLENNEKPQTHKMFKKSQNRTW